jgi:hypothetical protein
VGECDIGNMKYIENLVENVFLSTYISKTRRKLEDNITVVVW